MSNEDKGLEEIRKRSNTCAYGDDIQTASQDVHDLLSEIDKRDEQIKRLVSAHEILYEKYHGKINNPDTRTSDLFEAVIDER